MLILQIFLAVISPISLTQVVNAAATFGGVNHKFLQFLGGEERDNVINGSISGHSSAIRIIIRGLHPSETSIKGSITYPQPDPEDSLGEFDLSLLDPYDDILASVYRLSQGKTKVIIAPHDAKSIQKRNGLYCDAYCKSIGEDWQTFYTEPKYRAAYKERLSNIFNNYKSKNFNGVPWSTLSKVIIGVDLQNEPWSGVSPIPSGEDWICDIATHLNQTVGLGQGNILTISGGISGQNSESGEENWPTSAFHCPTLDVIGVHGAFADTLKGRAETPWARMLIPEMPLVATAADPRYGKRVIVEEWSYKPSTSAIRSKQSALYYTGEVFAFRGIPALYSSIISANESCPSCEPSDVNVLDTSNPVHSGTSSWYAVLHTIGYVGSFQGQSGARFNWSSLIYTPPNFETRFPIDTVSSPFNDPLCNGTQPISCLGKLCSSDRGCPSNSVCTNDICVPCNAGCVGQPCPCLQSNICSNGTCRGCGTCQDCVPGACLGGACNAGVICLNGGFCMTGICQECMANCPGQPCKVSRDCGTTGFCEQGICQLCLKNSGCIGQACSLDSDCKSDGKCSINGICAYA